MVRVLDRDEIHILGFLFSTSDYSDVLLLSKVKKFEISREGTDPLPILTL